MSGAAPLGGAIELPIVGHIQLGNGAAQTRDVRVQVAGDPPRPYAYVVLTTKWSRDEPFLGLLDVSHRRNPRQVNGLFGLSADADELWLEGGRVYVGNKTYGVEIVDISVPPALDPLGRFAWNSSGGPLVKGVHAVGDLLYVADELGLRIVDVTNPAKPELLGYVVQPFGEGVWGDGRIVYMAMDRTIGNTPDGPQAHPLLRIYDASDPKRPFLLSEAIAPVVGRAVDVQADGDRLFVAAEQGGVLAYGIADPAKPVYLGAFNTHFAHKIDVAKGLVYVADDEGGLVVVDASPPRAMRAVGYADTPGRAYGVTAAGRYAYVADGTEGIQIVDLRPLTPSPTVTSTQTPTVTKSPTPTPTRAQVDIPLVVK